MKNVSLYQNLKALTLSPGDDRKEVIRLRVLCLKNQLTDDDMETANALIEKYALVYECSECDWKGTPTGPDMEECPRCGKDSVYAEDLPTGFDAPTFLDRDAICTECGKFGRVTTLGDCNECYIRACRAEFNDDPLNLSVAQAFGNAAFGLLIAALVAAFFLAPVLADERRLPW